MGKIIAEMAATIAVVPLCATYLPGIHCANVEFGVVTGLALAILYLLLRPIARALTGLIGCLTFGLTNILVDAGLVLLCANVMKEGFRVDSFWWALALALAINAAGRSWAVYSKRSKRGRKKRHDCAGMRPYGH